MLSGTELYERLMRGLCLLQGARSRQVHYDGGEAHLLDVPGEGSLPPVVLLHGFSASGATQYMAMLPQLRRRVQRVILPDLPGHGLSSIPEPLDEDAIQRGLDGTLDRLIDTPAVVFATSLAGGFAIRYALRSPSKVLGLMLCSPCGAPLSREELEELSGLFRIDSHAGALRFVDRLFPRPHPLRQAYAWGVRQQFNRPHLVRWLERAADADFLRPDELSRLSMPVSLVWGASDAILPRRHLEFFRSHLPSGSEIDTPATFGHAPFLHRADEVNDRLLGFAARVARRHSRQ